MSRLAIAAALPFFLLLPACVGESERPGGDGSEAVGTRSDAVQSGTEIDPNNTGIVYVNGGCSGALLDNRWVLTAAHCARSYVDRSFGISGMQTTAFAGAQKTYGRGGAIDSQGRIVLGAAGSPGKIYLARLQPNGEYDTTFNAPWGAGVVSDDILTSSDEQVADVAVDSADRIVVAATFTTNGSRKMAALRYTAAGKLDTTFGSGGVTVVDFSSSTDEEAKAVRIDTQGRIVVAGTAASSEQYRRLIALVRLTPSGQLDTSFDGDGKVLTDLTAKSWGWGAFTLDKSNRPIVVGSTGISFGSSSEMTFVRYRSTDGSLDPLLGGDGVATVTVGVFAAFPTAITIDNAERIVVAGYGSDRKTIVGRLASSGAMDTSLSGDGWLTTTYRWGQIRPSSVGIDGKGGVVVTGVNVVSDVAIAFGMMRIGTDNLLDRNFGTGGTDDFLASNDPHASTALFDKSGHMFLVGDAARFGYPSALSVSRITLEHAVLPAPANFTMKMGSQQVMAKTIWRNGPLDVALVELAAPLSMNGNASTYEFQGFWGDSITSMKDKSFWCYGYGYVDQATRTGGGVLRYGVMPVTATSSTQYTLGPNESGQITTQGDSGGPCYAKDSANVWRHTGVHSDGSWGASPETHDVAAPAFSAWVRGIRGH